MERTQNFFWNETAHNYNNNKKKNVDEDADVELSREKTLFIYRAISLPNKIWIIECAKTLIECSKFFDFINEMDLVSRIIVSHFIEYGTNWSIII